MVALVGMAASLVPAATLYFQRADARHRAVKADGNRKRDYERDTTRVYEKYIELRQILLIIDGMGETDKDKADAKGVLKAALAHKVLPDPARHLLDTDEATNKHENSVS